jgi:hypothetical protein
MPLRLWHAARRSPTMIERIPADGRNCRSCVQARGGGHGTLLNARCRLRVRRRSPAPVRHGLDLDHSSRHRTDDRRRCLCATALNNHSGKSRQLKVSGPLVSRSVWRDLDPTKPGRHGYRCTRAHSRRSFLFDLRFDRAGHGEISGRPRKDPHTDAQ